MSGSLGVVPAGRLATLIGGRDKGALPLVSSTFLTHVIDRLTLQVNCIALNANSDGLRMGLFFGSLRVILMRVCMMSKSLMILLVCVGVLAPFKFKRSHKRCVPK